MIAGSCRQPKEAYFPEGKTFFGRDRHPKRMWLPEKNAAKRWKPATGNTSTGRKWNG